MNQDTGGVAGVKYEDNCHTSTGTGTDNGRHGDGLDQPDGEEASPPGIDHSISPGVPCPETVLVAVMTDGSYLLMSYPQGEPAAFVTAKDAGPLREALNGAFGTPTDIAVSTNGNGRHTSTVPPEHEALRTTQAQP